MSEYKKKMDIEEAISYCDWYKGARAFCSEKTEAAIETLLAEYHSFKSAYEQIRWERDVAIEQLSEIGKSLGEKMDDIKAQQQEITALQKALTAAVKTER